MNKKTPTADMVGKTSRRMQVVEKLTEVRLDRTFVLICGPLDGHI